MIIGHDNLLELYPNFKEDIKENGIDRERKSGRNIWKYKMVE